MVCPKCGNNNVVITFNNSVADTNKKGNGLGGNINNVLRLLTAICTLGLSNIFWKKSTGTSKTKIKQRKTCICQGCGYSWSMK